MRPRLFVPALAATLVAATVAPRVAEAQTTITVDAGANQHAISPFIYGVHFGGATALSDLNATINRYGGNSSGRYNWVQNIDNRGVDFFYESIPYATPVTGGEEMDAFIQATKAGGAEPFLTMPMVGSVAKTNMNRDVLWSFDTVLCGAQTNSDGSAGNGCKAGAPTGFDPCDPGHRFLAPYPGACHPDTAASQPADVNFQTGFAQHVKDTWGPASTTGLKFWGLDNEPSIWHNTYWDVHPHGAPDSETLQKMKDYGAMIKAVDPSVQVMGPEEWGWEPIFYSGADQEQTNQGTCAFFGGMPDCTDHAAHGQYTAYLLQQIHDRDAMTGVRTLDWFTLHYYPQSGEFSDDTTTAMQALRNRSTREFWDPNYTSESYINAKVMLIPRMKQLVADHYPGTNIGVTEYNWGAENHINGATAEADLLGIFGREGLGMAIRWVVPDNGSLVYNAFKMYRNYDGLKSTFGDVSVSATTADPDTLSAFAAWRTADGALTVMVVNKTASPSQRSVTVNLSNFLAGGPAQRWRLTSTNTIQHPGSIAVAANSFTDATVPAQSITLYVIPAGGAPAADLAITKTDGQVTATPGQPITYTIVASNLGPSTATGAMVTDTVPANITGATWTCVGASGGTCPASGAGNINASVTLPSGGTATFTLTGTVAAAASGTLSNTASITAPVGLTDPSPANNSATDSDTVSSMANLGITKTDGQATVTGGSAVTYTIVVSNAGPAAAMGAMVADSVSASIAGPMWTCVGSGGGTCTASGSGNIGQSVNLPSGASVTFTLTGTLKASATGSLTNTATVTAPAGITDPATGNNSATDTDTINAGQPAKDVLIGSTSSGTLASSGSSWFRYRVRAGRSYCVEVDNGKTDTNERDPYLAIYRPDAVTHVGDNDDIDTDEPAAHFLSRFCYIATTTEDNLALVTLTGDQFPGGFRLRVVDTTLFAPALGPLTPGSGFESFILIRNTTGIAHTAKVTLTGPGGTTIGSTQTGTVPADGSFNLQVSAAPPNGFGLANVSAGVWIAHDGPPGGLIANVTTLNFGSGVSYDTPALPRQDFR